MRYKTFLKEINTQDEEINKFIKWVNSLEKFPLSSDPAVIGLFLMDRLPENLIIGYKKTFLVYYEFEQNQLPKRYTEQQTFLNTLNKI